MKDYIATFHTHLSALRTQRSLTAAGTCAALSPVPRRLSASCGTCVRYRAETPLCQCMDTDYEKIVEVAGEDAYKTIQENLY